MKGDNIDQSLTRKFMDTDPESLIGCFSIVTTVSRKEWPDLHRRCDELFGDEWIWSSASLSNDVLFLFKNAEDAVLFKLMIKNKEDS